MLAFASETRLTVTCFDILIHPDRQDLLFKLTYRICPLVRLLDYVWSSANLTFGTSLLFLFFEMAPFVLYGPFFFLQKMVTFVLLSCFIHIKKERKM